MSAPFEALVLDLDGTLVGATDEIGERTRAALAEVTARGATVMVATGRSETGAAPVLEDLGITTPAVVFNGAGLWDPGSRRLIEERVLSERTATRVLEIAEEEGYLPVVQRRGEKVGLPPRTDDERRAFVGWTALEVGHRSELPVEFLMRITLFSGRHGDSRHFAEEVEEALGLPVYVTHFPLNVLATHPANPLHVLDLQPPCRGKAEALRWLAEERGIPAERVVAVGDASNDVPMLEAAGLGVAVEGAMADALAVAQRTVGRPGTEALAELVEELFGLRV